MNKNSYAKKSNLRKYFVDLKSHRGELWLHLPEDGEWAMAQS